MRSLILALFALALGGCGKHAPPANDTTTTSSLCGDGIAGSWQAADWSTGFFSFTKSCSVLEDSQGVGLYTVDAGGKLALTIMRSTSVAPGIYHCTIDGDAIDCPKLAAPFLKAQ